MIRKMTSIYKGKGYPRYYCSSAQKPRQSCAYYNGHSAPKLEAAIEADFAKNLDLLKRDLLNEEEFKQANEARPEEQAQLQARLEELASSLTAQSQRHDAVDALPVQIRSFLKDVQSLDVLRAKALLQPIMRTASVDRECTIELAFK
jgi:hypothetical protein